jgi:hypothetical protein
MELNVRPVPIPDPVTQVLHCGLPMEVVFEQREEFALPQFWPRR